MGEEEGRTLDENARYVRITVRTADGETLNGRVNMAGKDRLSDVFTSEDSPFFVLVDVATEDLGGRTLFVNKHHVVWVETED